MKKYGWLLFLAFWLCFIPSFHRAEAAGTNLFLDGERLETSGGTTAEMVNGKIMVPLRIIGQELGYKFDWEPKEYKVIVHKSNTDISMFVGRTTAYVGSKEVQLDSPPLLRGSTTLVPLRFVGEQLGLSVKWDNATKAVYLQKLAADDTDKNGESKGDDSGTTEGEDGNTDEDTDESEKTRQVHEISFSDGRLTVSADEGRKPEVFTMTNPDRIVVDFQDAEFVEGLTGQYPEESDGTRLIEVDDNEDVQLIRFAQYDEDEAAARIVLVLNRTKGYSVTQEDEQYVITLGEPVDEAGSEPEPANPAMPAGEEGRWLVVLDAGHGGKDPGATSVTGRTEKEFNLSVALRVQEKLRDDPDIELVMTRDGDTYPELAERSSLANGLNANVFISIHANSMPKTAAGALANGSETYYTRNDSQELALMMHKNLVEATGLKDNGVKVKNLHVTRETKMPAVLLEAGYLSNVGDEAALFSEETQNRIADGIVNALREYLGL
ncbi:N-acetylmuramoyl-L-alanine amidase family protein [Paenibacillus sp. P96]|uniref:N-acetylmuramoyl-L-alanine amidase family protein n=1 Tax=Paenibacillus zeirhizosphaerae TaxID=2987519 RepID=A0ABT9FPD2_9BACL|nr:N-acetylmuramoyl-L-alanine amidase family protein [Paenibacillus sp. P96]MDP4096583.1 N-acetylmuramoyl-L-alanine amidase family protein [Paenibacillus sp. P96]